MLQFVRDRCGRKNVLLASQGAATSSIELASGKLPLVVSSEFLFV
jgi:hypothetical protein